MKSGAMAGMAVFLAAAIAIPVLAQGGGEEWVPYYDDDGNFEGHMLLTDVLDDDGNYVGYDIAVPVYGDDGSLIGYDEYVSVFDSDWNLVAHDLYLWDADWNIIEIIEEAYDENLVPIGDGSSAAASHGRGDGVPTAAADTLTQEGGDGEPNVSGDTTAHEVAKADAVEAARSEVEPLTVADVLEQGDGEGWVSYHDDDGNLEGYMLLT
ncbi:MAG: hypothetical protein OXU37_08620, partial [Thaumarchaeota archaeon]|nr:hypothetical protein [Nitrososphaerota archaeon]